jgi:hypothetical protein
MAEYLQVDEGSVCRVDWVVVELLWGILGVEVIEVVVLCLKEEGQRRKGRHLSLAKSC